MKEESSESQKYFDNKDSLIKQYKQKNRSLETQLSLTKQEKCTVRSQLETSQNDYYILQKQYDDKDMQKRTYTTQYNSPKQHLKQTQEELQNEKNLHQRAAVVTDTIAMLEQREKIGLLENENAQYQEELLSTKQDAKALEALLKSLQGNAAETQQEADTLTKEKNELLKLCEGYRQDLEVMKKQQSLNDYNDNDEEGCSFLAETRSASYDSSENLVNIKNQEINKEINKKINKIINKRIKKKKC